MSVDTQDGGDDDVRSFTSPDTSFTILKDGQFGHVTGYMCDECEASAKSLFDIDHDAGCSQAGVQ